MDLPTIDLASLPGLEAAQGVYGSASQLGGTYEDVIVSIMVLVYDSGVTGALM